MERSFGALEGHGAQSWRSYFLTLPFCFVTLFVSFFPWSIKLPALTRRLWRQRDAIDKYLISGAAFIFILMTIVKTKLPHYTLIAFPLLSLLLAHHLFELPGSFRFPARAALTTLALSLGASLFVFPLVARTFPSAELFRQSRNDLLPGMDFANVDYFEPSVVWYFRGRTHGFFRGLNPDMVHKFMEAPGPRFAIMPVKIAQANYPELPPQWKSYHARGFTFVKGRPADLTMILKPTP